MTKNSTDNKIEWETLKDESMVRREKKFYLQSSYNRYVQKNMYKGLAYICLVPELREATELSVTEVEEYRKAVMSHSKDLWFTARGFDTYRGYGVIDTSECYSPSDFLLVTVETETIIPLSDYVIGIDIGIL